MAALGALRAEAYEAATFDMSAPLPDGRGGAEAWVEVFRLSVEPFRRRCAGDPSVPEPARAAGAAAFAARYSAALDLLAGDPEASPEGLEGEARRGARGRPGLSCLRLCAMRDACMRREGFHDPFRAVKARENVEALRTLPAVLAELDAQPSPRARMELALRGVLAGNIFDLGASASAELWANGGAAFAETRGRLLARPWAVDDLDEALERLGAPGRYRKAVLFVDNAGSDVVLGMLPLCRELLKGGTRVVLAANELPNINDITAEELAGLFTCLASRPRVEDEVLLAAARAGTLRVVSTGSDLPVIDLTDLSEAFVQEAAGCDLVVLEGMGRAIETNLRAEFTCDALNIGMVKHPEVAQCLGGRLFDGVVRFRRPTTQLN